MAAQTLQAVRLGRREYRGDPHLLLAAAAAPQAHEVDQHARTPEPGIEAAHPCGAHLPECGELLAAGAGACRRDPRELARRHPLFEHAASGRAQKRSAAASGMIGFAPNPAKSGPVLTAVKTAARRLRRWPTASLDRGCARCHGKARSGRRNGASIEQRNWLLVPCSTHRRNQLANVTVTIPTGVRTCPDVVSAPCR